MEKQPIKKDLMLICHTHDSILDKGLRAFKDNGEIIILKEIEKYQYRLLNIDENVKLGFISRQLPYIKYYSEEEVLDKKTESKIEPKEITDRVESLNKEIVRF